MARSPLPGDPARTTADRPTDRKRPHIVLIMGVAGAGKSTIGLRLAADLDWPLLEADDLHSDANRDKMSRGVPLDDVDRVPWLAALRVRINEFLANGRNAVVVCSALKKKYRQTLMDGTNGVWLVHLSGDLATIQSRVGSRKGHFMKVAMLQSQFETLETPDNAVVLDVRQPPDVIVAEIRRRCGL